MKYTLELTQPQFDLIANCVEVCHRIACGDTAEMLQILPFCDNEAIVRRYLANIKREAFPELHLGEHYPWNGGHADKPHDRFQKETYAIYREMRHADAIARAVDNVYATPTLTCGVKLPKISITSE